MAERVQPRAPIPKPVRPSAPPIERPISQPAPTAERPTAPPAEVTSERRSATFPLAQPAPERSLRARPLRADRPLRAALPEATGEVPAAGAASVVDAGDATPAGGVSFDSSRAARADVRRPEPYAPLERLLSDQDLAASHDGGMTIAISSGNGIPARRRRPLRAIRLGEARNPAPDFED